MLNYLKGQYKRQKPLFVVFSIGLITFLALILITIRIPGSDDTVFQNQILPFHNLLDWVVFRYQNWSGRIFSELFVYIFSQAPLYLWKIVSFIFYAVFSVMIFLYYRLLYNRHNNKKDILMLAFAFCAMFLMDTDALRFGMFWVTGSMNYFWIATLGLVGFYPVVHYITQHRLPNRAFVILGLLSSIVASCSQEQVGVIIVGLSSALLIYELYMHSKNDHPLPFYLIVNGLAVTTAFMASILAPGNALRIKAETIHWLPDFYTAPLPQHIEYGYRWFLEATINHTGFLLVIPWGLMALLFLKKQNKTKFQVISTYLLAILCLATLTKGYTPISFWYNYYATWKPSLPNLLSYLPLIPWLIAIVGTIAAPIILFGKENIGKILSLLFLAAFASIAMITLSPTMYASGWRILFVPSVILVLITYFILSKAVDEYKNNKYFLVTLVATPAILGYIYMALRLVHGLTL